MIEQIKRSRKIGKDFFINIIASGVMTAALQIVVYPFFAMNLDKGAYGLLITITGIVNTIISALGNSLNNVRLVKNEVYETDDNDDFNILLVIGCVISIFISIIIFAFVFNMNVSMITLLLLNVVMGILRSYYQVAFRIFLNFKKILTCNTVIAVGYLLGLELYYLLDLWPVVFIFGEFFGLIYLSKKSFLVSNGLKRTEKFMESLNTYINFSLSAGISSALTYLDRLIILPILGSELVAIYSVASIIGKTLGIIMFPIAGVLLGYYCQKNFSMSKKMFIYILILCIGICMLFYFFTMLIGQAVTGILYPTVIKDAAPYISLANFAAVIGVLGNMISPTVVRYAKPYWQAIITGIYGILYLGLGVCFSIFWNLYGFCFASILANLVRVVVMIVVGIVSIGERSKI